MQYNAIQCDALQSNMTWCDAVHWRTVREMMSETGVLYYIVLQTVRRKRYRSRSKLASAQWYCTALLHGLTLFSILMMWKTLLDFYVKHKNNTFLSLPLRVMSDVRLKLISEKSEWSYYTTYSYCIMFSPLPLLSSSLFISGCSWA